MTRCPFCNRGVGKNDLLPDLPVGKRLAFDPANDRLWTICHSCGCWSLAPLDDAERHAAVVRLEQFYAATPARTESAGIGVADVHGTLLVRIGTATFSQFAAWRYGRRLSRRRLTSAVLFALWGATALWIYTPAGDRVLSTTVGSVFFMAVLGAIFWWSAYRPMLRTRATDGRRAAVRPMHLRHATIVVDARGWRLLLKHSRGVSALEGREAVRGLAAILPHIHQRGAGAGDIAAAIQTIEAAGGPETLLAEWLTPERLGPGPHELSSLPRPFSLALEMAAHEETERLALKGDIATMSLDWRQADETARLADRLG